METSTPQYLALPAQGLRRLERLDLYQTSTYIYLIGCDINETIFRVLKLDRRVRQPKSLGEILTEDPMKYDKHSLAEMLKMVHEGNKAMGGLKKVTSAFGLVGFAKFLDCYYITLIMQRRKVGCIGGNFIYTIKATEVFPIRPSDDSQGNVMEKMWRTLNKKLTQTRTESDENRYLGLFSSWTYRRTFTSATLTT